MTKNRREIQFRDLIIQESEDIIVINKPPFVSTLEDRRSNVNILGLAKTYCPEAQVCHRLDKNTSGLLIIAKHHQEYVRFSSLFENREVVKIYHALVGGRRSIDELEIDAPLYSTSNRTRVDYRIGKPSVTLISTHTVFKKHTLLACMPFTGRMHQIRVHLTSQDMPIIGDAMYGGKDLYLSEIKKNYRESRSKPERPLNTRMLLHAAGLAFPDKNGIQQKFEAPYPHDFEMVLKQLQKNSS